jgi:hypothetical protein
MLTACAIFICMAASSALAQGTNVTTATIIGQVTVNGTPTNGVSVTCGSGSATTTSYQGTDGVYAISGLPFGVSLPFKATYQGYTYTDTVDPLPSGQQYIQIPAVNINTQAGTPTPAPTPVPNATATPTPAPNATATPTPTPAPNATATPTPAPNATATPSPTATPQPTSPPAQAPPPAPPAPTTIYYNYNPPTPTADIKQSINMSVSPTPTLAATAAPTMPPTPTPAPAPTQTQSPGFPGLLAIACVIGAALYLIAKRQR